MLRACIVPRVQTSEVGYTNFATPEESFATLGELVASAAFGKVDEMPDEADQMKQWQPEDVADDSKKCFAVLALVEGGTAEGGTALEVEEEGAEYERHIYKKND
jgi:hypothetical protein